MITGDLVERIEIWRGRSIFAACLTVLVAGLLLGGGSRNGLPGDAILQLAALPLVWLSLRGLMSRGLERFTLAEIVVVVGLIAIPLLQLVPLPPALWTRLPHADLRGAPFALLGRELDYRPISLTPEATALSVLSLAPAIALFIGARLLPTVRRRQLVVAVLPIALASAFLGILQLAGGEQSPLRFYSVTNPSDAVGFFANRNHLAALLYVSILLTAPWALDGLFSFLEARGVGRMAATRLTSACLCGTLMFILGVAEIATRSRAGVALTILSAVGIAALMARDPRNRWKTVSLRLFGVAIAVVVLFSMQFGFDQFVDRLAVDPSGDGRLSIAEHTIEAAKSFLPFGSGVGSFVSVYGQWEAPTDLIPNVYINQAHDDLLQIGLEAGVAGLFVVGIFVIAMAIRTISLLSTSGERAAPLDTALKRAAAMAAICLFLHSLVDYPLRTSAGMILFALCCAVASQPSASSRGPSLQVLIPAPPRKRVRVSAALTERSGVVELANSNPAEPGRPAFATSPARDRFGA
jgi:hypothetical protein